MNATTLTLGKPEFFRLPKRGGDPYFGLTRPWYYQAEQRGDLRLVRIRERGKARGITLVPYDETAALIRSKMAPPAGTTVCTAGDVAGKNA